MIGTQEVDRICGYHVFFGIYGVVEERSVCAEVVTVRCGGAYRSENVGISSIKAGENPAHRKRKVSWATQIDPGLGGPKARPKGVVDGQQVNIPALLVTGRC